MRMLLSLLVLANLAALAWWQGWVAPWAWSPDEHENRAAEIAPERLRVVSGARLEGAAPAQPPGVADSGEETAAGKDPGAAAAAGLPGPAAADGQAPRVEGARSPAETVTSVQEAPARGER